MISKAVKVALLSALAIVALAAQAGAQWLLDLEGGLARSGYNDVRIPGDTGTLFSLSEELDASSATFFRLRLSAAGFNRLCFCFGCRDFFFHRSRSNRIDFNNRISLTVTLFLLVPLTSFLFKEGNFFITVMSDNGCINHHVIYNRITNCCVAIFIIDK